jgi:hypothetical protein
MNMVSKTVPRHKLFGWTLHFECTAEHGDWIVHYYDPNGKDLYRIKLDAATKTMAKGLITQIQAWMNQQDVWAGTVIEHREKQQVQKTGETVEEWVVVP